MADERLSTGSDWLVGIVVVLGALIVGGLVAVVAQNLAVPYPYDQILALVVAASIVVAYIGWHRRS